MSELLRLPFDEYEAKFLDLVRNNQVVILAAETGAGKSTKAPLALLNAGFGGNKLIGVTQPRRPAATMLAKWVAELHGTELGSVVGYQIGQDRNLDRNTRLAYVTEGIVLNQLHSDQTLARYSVLVLDEMHERGVNQDLLMALVKRMLPSRPDIKVVVMSATIDTKKFSTYFGGAPVLEVPGRMFPVKVRWANETPENGGMIRACADKILEILFGREPGDILAFMPDQDSIIKVVKLIETELEQRPYHARILPLFGAQAPEDQEKVFNRDGVRRVIIATNIAETSLTIDGVRHVVDSGQIKAMVYKDASMSALQVTEHSRAGCDQRLGRAGRTQDGICHRLFTEEDFNARDGFTKPEILRMALDQVLLELRCLDYTLEEILALDFMDAPEVEQWKDAEARLKLLGALDQKGVVTEDGKRMKRLQVDPMVGRMIIEGQKRGCLNEVLTIAACLSATRPIFVRKKGEEKEADAAHQQFKNPSSDMLTFLKVWNAWDETDGDHRWARDHYLSSRALSQVDRLRGHLIDVLSREGVEGSASKSDVSLSKAVAAGLIVNLAKKVGRFNYLWNDRATFIFPGSSVMGTTPQLLVCAKVVESTGEKGPKAYMRGVHAIEMEWLKELIPMEACAIEIVIEKKLFSDEIEVVCRRTWNGIEFERETLEMIPEALIPFIAEAAAKQIAEGYGFFCDRAIQLVKLRARFFLVPMFGVYGEARQKFLEPAVNMFAPAIAKKIAGKPTIELMVAAIGSMTAEDILMGDALKAYQAEYAAEMQRDREDAESRVRREEEARRASEQAQADFAPLREEFAALDARVRAIGYVFDYLGGKRMEFCDDNRREIARDAVEARFSKNVLMARHDLQRYAEVVVRLEREYAERIERERIEHEVCVVVHSQRIRLPESLVEHRELIQMWLSELEEARKALQTELAWVETLKRGVAKGEIIALTFQDRGDGFMVAEWKHEKVLAPTHDLNLYPQSGESWWCHVIPGNGPTQIFLCRKVGTKKADIEKILRDGLDMFPGLPTQLLQ